MTNWNKWLESAAEKYRREQDGDCTPKGSKVGEHPYLFCECDMEKAYADGIRAALQSPVVLEMKKALEELKENWDISNFSSVVPKWHHGELAPNDSLAAGAIIRCVHALTAYHAATSKANEEKGG